MLTTAAGAAQQYPLLIEKKVKNELRKGVPQTYRRLVWMRLSGAEEYCRGDYDGYYESAVRLRSSPDKADRLLTLGCVARCGCASSSTSCRRGASRPWRSKVTHSPALLILVVWPPQRLTVG